MICQLGHSAREVGTWLIGIALGDPGSASGNPTSRSCLLGNPSRVAETQIPGWVTGSEEGEGRNVIRQESGQAPRHQAGIPGMPSVLGGEQGYAVQRQRLSTSLV